MGLFTKVKGTTARPTKSAQSKNNGKKKKNASSENPTVEEKDSRRPRGSHGARSHDYEPQQSTAGMSGKVKKSKKKGASADKAGDAAAADAKLKAMSAPKLVVPPDLQVQTPPDKLLTIGDDDGATTTTQMTTMSTMTMTRNSTSREALSRENVSAKGVVDMPPSIKAQLTAPIPVGGVGGGEKWAAEATARAWIDKADFQKAKAEFEKLSKMTVSVEKDCKKWKSHPKLNQPDDYPVLDANLVKCDVEYVNMSHVEVPLHRNVVLGQFPVAGSEEAFWKAVFEVRATSIHVLTGDDETFAFFPQKHGDFMHYGTMFVNNRRVESVNEDVLRFAIEVLPDGLSNSIICNVTVIKNWSIDSVHAKHSVVIKETIELNNFLSSSPADEKALIMSKHGAGRAGYFISLSIAVTKMDQKMEPNLMEIVRSIRAQRPKAVETLTQYASLYISMFYYIKRKTSKTAEGDKKAVSDPNDPLCRKSVHLTSLFTNALMAEVAASGGRSMMTIMK